jgi:hypothetical protein
LRRLLAVLIAIIAETPRLRDKFHRPPEWIAEADRQLRVITRIVQPTERIQAIEPDPTNDRILECAVARTDTAKRTASSGSRSCS